jgi:tRNA nucleotidyltransferase (CCA-adding enzyme)
MARTSVRGTGHTAAEAFEQAALALTAWSRTRTSRRGRQCATLRRPDKEQLLYDWLNAAKMKTRGMLFGRFAVTLDEHRLGGKRGRAGRPRAPSPGGGDQGATYTALPSRATPVAWTACVVDV